MKFKFKFGDFFLGLATFVVIVLSIILWIFIMTSDQRFSRINQTNNQVTRGQARTKNNKSLYDLYIPTNAYGFIDGKPYRLYDSKNNLPFEFTKELRQVTATDLKKIGNNRTQYQELLNNPNFIQLSYPDQVTFGLFTPLANSKQKNRELNRIIIPDKNKWVYLGNDQSNTIYKVSLKKANFNRLRRYAKKAKNKTPVNFVRLKSSYSAFYSKSVNWSVYSYITTSQSDSYFVSRLLGTSGVTSKTNKNGRTTYSYNYYTRLKVPAAGERNDHNFQYTHFEKGKIPSVNNRLLDSVYYVHKLGMTEQDLRFFDADNNVVRYTNYIEGIPVFLNDHDLQVNNSFSSDAINIEFNSINFQIPIPFDGQTQSLESTYDLVDSLEKHGLHQNDIERIMVGFKVEKDNSHHSLVNLIPTYYIKAYGEWKSQDEWQKQNISIYKDMEVKSKEEVK